MTTRIYEVAGHRMAVSAAGEVFGLMGNYEPFAVADDGQEPLMSLTIGKGLPDRGAAPPDFTEELRQEDEGQTIVCGRAGDGNPVFGFHWQGQPAGWLACTADYRTGRLALTGHAAKMVVDNALMVLYALATARLGTLLFHAAAVASDGRGYLFLGPSGTGKSTHARLWLRHIGGSHLVNDDNPVVRILPPPPLASPSAASAPEGRAEEQAAAAAVVYGSPWSGKTPCYLNEAWPLGGIVQLRQAPCNQMHRLQGVGAYAALVASTSGKRWDRAVADGLHQSENALAQSVPVWHLDCLPDREAALLCSQTLAPA